MLNVRQIADTPAARITSYNVCYTKLLRRILNEFKQICEEKNARACILRMEEFKLLQNLHEGLELNVRKKALLEKIEEVLDWHRLLYLEHSEPEPWLVFLLALSAEMEDGTAKSLTERLNFSKRDQRDFLSLRQSVNQTFQAIASWVSSYNFV